MAKQSENTYTRGRCATLKLARKKLDKLVSWASTVIVGFQTGIITTLEIMIGNIITTTSADYTVTDIMC